MVNRNLSCNVFVCARMMVTNLFLSILLGFPHNIPWIYTCIIWLVTFIVKLHIFHGSSTRDPEGRVMEMEQGKRGGWRRRVDTAKNWEHISEYFSHGSEVRVPRLFHLMVGSWIRGSGWKWDGSALVRIGWWGPNSWCLWLVSDRALPQYLSYAYVEKKNLS